jgi:hypothetical protein
MQSQQEPAAARAEIAPHRFFGVGSRAKGTGSSTVSGASKSSGSGPGGLALKRTPFG